MCHGHDVQLDDASCWERLRAARHGVLGTVHATRAVDAVPVVFVVHDDQVVIPIDTVKPKAGGRLQRLRNLDRDDRAVLLVDHYDDDWSALWWIRLDGTGRLLNRDDEYERAMKLLVDKYQQYEQQEPSGPLIAIDVDHWTAWP